MAVPAIAAKAVVSAAGKQAAKSAVKKDIAKGVAAGTKRTTEKVVQKRMAASLKRQASQQVLDGIGKVSKQMLPNNGKGLPTNLYDGASKLAQGAISGEGASQAAKDAAGDVLAKGAETAVNKGLDVASKAGPAPVRVAAKLGKKVMQSDAAREKLKDAAKAGMPDLKKDGEEDSEKDGGSFLNPFGKKGKKGLAGKLLRAGVPMIALQAISFALPILLLVGVMLSVGSCAAAGIFGLTSGGGESNREVIEQGSGSYIPRVEVEETKGFCDDEEESGSAPSLSGFNAIAQEPELPTGCEVTSLAATLAYLGYPIDKCELADKYLDKGSVDTADPNKEFVGNPRGQDFGCFAPVIVNCANKYLSEKGADATVADETGKSLSELCSIVDGGTPVIIWGTQRNEPSTGETQLGSGVTWKSNEHCMVLVGHSDSEVSVADPLEGSIVSYPKDKFEENFNTIGKRAVTIKINGAQTSAPSSSSQSSDGGSYTDRGDCIQKNQKSTSTDGWVLYNQVTPNWKGWDGSSFGSSCGQVAMAMVCATYGGDGDKYTPNWLRTTEMRFGNEGLNQSGCVNYINSHQSEFHLKASSGHWCADSGSWDRMKKICDEGGCIVMYQKYYSSGGMHWVTVIDVEGDTVTVANPATGKIEDFSKKNIVSKGCPNGPGGAPDAIYLEKV